jgi:hypothetical protein
MPTNLVNEEIQDTYNQVLHIDGGLDASLKSIYGGAGSLSAAKLSSSAFSVANLSLSGNLISSLDVNGNITITPNGAGLVVISAASITGGSVVGITDLAVADGGTGASTAAGARTNLLLGTIATQDANNVTITGGAITGSYSGLTLISSSVLTAVSSMGFGTGAGGIVTQATSKSTGVTLNKSCGQITMNGAILNATTSVSFTLTNSVIEAKDIVHMSIVSGASVASYFLSVDATAAGSCVITLRNYTAGNLTETPVINFAVIKGALS